MKVKELRKKLKEFDKNLDVEFTYHDASYGETFEGVEDATLYAESYSLTEGKIEARVVLG